MSLSGGVLSSPLFQKNRYTEGSKREEKRKEDRCDNPFKIEVRQGGNDTPWEGKVAQS